MARDRTQPSRFELKYLLAEETALRVRDLVRCYLDIDEYAVGRPDYSYPVHSLYLDSDDLALYWDTVNGSKNRYKLRLRYYSNGPGAPVFFEIKRRMKDLVLKQRGGVKPDAVARLLNGHLPEPSDMVSKDAGSLVAVQRFQQLMLGLNARPKSHIFFMREAYVADNDEVRVTLDRNILSEPHLTPAINVKMTRPVQSYAGRVILELKFTQRFPNWFRELVRIANVLQCGAAKYPAGVELLGRVRLHAHAEVLESESLLSNFRPGDDLPTSARQDRGIIPGLPPELARQLR